MNTTRCATNESFFNPEDADPGNPIMVLSVAGGGSDGTVCSQDTAEFGFGREAE